jgi:creatinine amidohydrolase
MACRYWSELTAADLSRVNPERTVAVIPVAAIEQHGPHLPLGTDAFIAEGMIAEVFKNPPAAVDALFLPVQKIGKSNEHVRWPGTLTFNAATLLQAWTEIGEAVNRGGVRKAVFVNSHGGNSDILSVVARELRVRFGMLAVHTHWMRFGYPGGIYTEEEILHGIHAGDIETSLMLYFRPDLVGTDKLRNFEPASARIAKEFDLLRPSPPHAFAWMAQDLNPAGAAGDATLATAEKGRLTAAHQAAGFARLLEEVAAFSLEHIVP